MGLAQLIEAHTEQSAVAWVCLHYTVRRECLRCVHVPRCKDGMLHTDKQSNGQLSVSYCQPKMLWLTLSVLLQTLAYAAPEVLMDEKCVRCSS